VPGPGVPGRGVPGPRLSRPGSSGPGLSGPGLSGSATAGPAAAAPASETAAIEDPVDELPDAPTPRGARSRPTSGPPFDDREVERGLRGLVGSGSSQVSVGAAMRARDAARPTEAQLTDAEQNLTIVRRNWTPREDLPRNR
jgi:hypothetical protein